MRSRTGARVISLNTLELCVYVRPKQTPLAEAVEVQDDDLQRVKTLLGETVGTGASIRRCTPGCGARAAKPRP